MPKITTVTEWTLGNDIPESYTMAVVAVRQDGEVMAGEAVKHKGQWYWVEASYHNVKMGVENALEVLAWAHSIQPPEGI